MRSALTLACLFGLVCLFFSKALTGTALLVERDLTTFFYPFRHLWVELVKQGHFPFWNPYIKCGVPLFAAIQPAVFYPLSLVYLLLPLDLAFNWTIIIHFYLAGAFTYLLVRELGGSAAAGMSGAIAFGFGGYLVSAHNVLNTLISVSWYPLVMWCGCRLVRRGGIKWIAATSLTLACMFLGGGLEIVLFTLASLLIICLYPGILPLNPQGGRPGLLKRLASCFLVILFFLGLVMVQLLPFLELYRESVRAGGVPLEQATRWSLAGRDLAYLILPDLFGPHATPELYWETQNYLKTIYVGPVVLFLAALFFARQGRRGLPLVAGMLLALLLALGAATPLYGLLYNAVPLFSSIRYPVKFLFLSIFYLCVAAGLGLDYLGERCQQRRFRPGSQILLVGAALVAGGLVIWCRLAPEQALAAIAALMATRVPADFLPVILHNVTRLLVIGAIISILLFFGGRQRLKRALAPLLLLLLAVDVFLGNRGYMTTLDAKEFHATTEIIAALQADPDLFRFHVLPEVRDLEIDTYTYAQFHRVRKELLNNDLMIEHHLFDVDGYNVPLQKRYEEFIGLLRWNPLPVVVDLLDLLNVKYVLAAGETWQPGYAWVRDGIDRVKLYRNGNVLGRAFLTNEFMVGDAEGVLRTITEAGVDLRRTVLLEQVPHRFLELRQQPRRPGLGPKVKITTYEANRVVVEVQTPEAALLFMSEAYYPGWQAYVDGQREEILRADYVFRAVPVGPGIHQVEVVCRPLSFKIGLAVTLVTAAAMVLLVAIRGGRRWRY